jgi:hypothetical protein
MFETGPAPRLPPDQHRWIALAVALVALAAIASSLVTTAILVDDMGDGSMSCGLRACEACWGHGASATCTTTSTIQLVDDIILAKGEASPAWGWSGTIAWFASIVGGVGLLFGAGMVAVRRYVRLPVSPTTITLVGAGAALIAGCVYVATKPEAIGVTEVGWAFWAFGGGVIAAIVAAFLLSRQLALLEPEFDPGDSPAEQPDEPWQDV